MNLVIVESPVKSKTIQGFLGPEFLVRSSYGHIRDLPEKELGVDVAHNFKPKYVIPYKAKKHITHLKKYLPEAKTVILSTDADREGEAIAYHLIKILNLNGTKPYQRIVFHEITKQAVEKALKNPRKIDMNLVNAQQARRILDRLVGYKLSPFLWKKLFRGLSAGRVQSVALRLVVEREREIKNFVAQEYWTIVASLLKTKNKKIEATLIKKDGKPIPRLGIKNKEEADGIINDLKDAEYRVINIDKKEVKRNPPPPFTTSTLQQDAWTKLRLPAKTTMRIAQQLYETGRITYHRTDSLNLSKMSQMVAKKFIEENYGKQYWPGFARTYQTKSKMAQEAHEAIRPTYPDKIPEDLKIRAKLDERQYRLYRLIWQRFMACQMAQAKFDSSQVDISANNYIFRASGQLLKFDGFLKVYPMKFEENELPPLRENEILTLKKLVPCQHFTQPPPRYSEASLIKTLEKEGIGRPSTYAPILETIQQRNYIAKNEQRKFQPTEIGILVNDLLVKHFPEIVDIKFTARMEDDLDKIASGKASWVKILKEFYQPFEKNLKEKESQVSKNDLIEKTEKICPQCQSPLMVKWSRYGKFYACSKFPDCRYKESMSKPSLDISCPKCQKGEIVEKKTKKGKIFYGCNCWPECDFALWNKPFTILVKGKPISQVCPKCGSLLVETSKKQIKCSNNNCKFKK